MSSKLKDNLDKQKNGAASTKEKGILHLVINSFKMHLDGPMRKKAAILIVLIFSSAILDVFGIASILPLIKLATDTTIIHSNEYLNAIYNYFHFESEKQFLLVMILSVLSFFILKSVYGVFVNYLETRFTATLAYKITRKQFNKYFNLEFHQFTGMKSSVITHHILNNPLSYVTWVVMPTIMLISEFSILFLIVSGIAWYDIKLFLFIAIIIGPSTWLIYALLRSRVTRIGEEMNRLFPLSLGSISQTIGGYADIKLANKEAHYRDEFLKTQKKYHQLNMASHLPNLIPLRANELVALLGVVLIFIYAIFLTDNSEKAIVMISLFAAAAYRLMPSLNRIISSFMYIRKNMTAMQNISIYPELSHEIISNQDNSKMAFENAIEIKNLFFHFPNEQKDMLKDISMTVKRGEKIGIVGVSGSGKTTLMNILLRFYNEQKGGIYIDQVKIDAANQQSWRNLLGYVKQDIFLMDASISDNITFGDENPDPIRLKQAIKQASLEDLINALPNGLQTIIGERGSRLSGGQKQRISIARSLYRNAEILIFDEATSALDNQTEQEVSEAIDSLSEVNKTIFIIAHRVTTLKNCNRIYELTEGKISGVYKYHELLEKVV